MGTKYSHSQCGIRACTATTSSSRLGGNPRGRWSILVRSLEFRARGPRSCSLGATKTFRIVRRVPNIQNTRCRCLRTCTCQGRAFCHPSILHYEYLRWQTCTCLGHAVCFPSTLRRTLLRWHTWVSASWDRRMMDAPSLLSAMAPRRRLFSSLPPNISCGTRRGEYSLVLRRQEQEVVR